MKRLLALLLVLVIAHNVQSRREQDALVRCVTQAQGDLEHLLDKAYGAEQYGGAQLTSPSVPASVRASLAKIVTDTVADELPALRADRARCDYWELPWHGQERDAYVTYLDARLRQLDDASRSRDALHTDPAATARAAAQRALSPLGLTVTP